jgi:hypothetical protein
MSAMVECLPDRSGEETKRDADVDLKGTWTASGI